MNKFFKKILIGTAFTFGVMTVKADEGMWLPNLMKVLNEPDMKTMGFKLSAEDIYSINQSSLKDAIIQFGGGCTGEVISQEGLILTNHHCGYKHIQGLSSVKNDYLTNGFWAQTKEQELPAPGLTAMFVIRIDDVTSKVLEGVGAELTEKDRQEKIDKNVKKIEAEAVPDKKYDAKVRSFFYGNEYYLFITQTFKDVRLVGTPPQSIGKFGGDTDNWMWPRHTGDFSLFRIYANENNEPAEYSASNKPFKSKRTLDISLKGVSENDLTLIYGFPGRTYEYLTSHAIKQTVLNSHPLNIRARDIRLSLIKEDMKASDEVRIKYAAKYASVSNYYKKWIGEIRSIRLDDVVKKKEDQESAFNTWVNADASRKTKYATLTNDFSKAYTELAPLQKCADLMNEAILATEGLAFALRFDEAYTAAIKEGAKDEDVKKELDKLKKGIPAFFKDYNKATDQKVCAALLKYYFEKLDKNLLPSTYKTLTGKYKGDYQRFVSEMYADSKMLDVNFINELIEKGDVSKLKKLKNDAMFSVAKDIYSTYEQNTKKQLAQVNEKINTLYRIYVAGLREMQPGKKFYPDANSTLRATYGKIKGYKPYDGAMFDYYSTLEGVIEKADSLNSEFIVPKKLMDLYNNKDYGNYGMNGKMPVCFIANNHTTGGNSGSPVLDAEGKLIGLNFDGAWEGAANNMFYNPDRVRIIAVDIRYVLFLVDKFAGATHLIKEMNLIK